MVPNIQKLIDEFSQFVSTQKGLTSPVVDIRVEKINGCGEFYTYLLDPINGVSAIYRGEIQQDTNTEETSTDMDEFYFGRCFKRCFG